MQGRPRTIAGQSQGRAELDLLTTQRRMLQEQAEQLGSRRSQLFAQLGNTPEGAARSGLESRMAEIDGRLARLDGQIEQLNERIMEVSSRPGAASGPVIVEVPRPAPQITIPPINFGRQRGPDMEQVGAMMAGEAVILALIGFAFWRFGVRQLRTRFERAFVEQSGQINQLQQAVDVIGVEIERISEGQRYVAKVLTEGTPVERARLVEQKERR